MIPLSKPSERVCRGSRDGLRQKMMRGQLRCTTSPRCTFRIIQKTQPGLSNERLWPQRSFRGCSSIARAQHLVYEHHSIHKASKWVFFWNSIYSSICTYSDDNGAFTVLSLHQSLWLFAHNLNVYRRRQGRMARISIDDKFLKSNYVRIGVVDGRLEPRLEWDHSTQARTFLDLHY